MLAPIPNSAPRTYLKETKKIFVTPKVYVGKTCFDLTVKIIEIRDMGALRPILQ